ncbi:hypothetical protein RN001_004761 [Aquatica leii]|uniref:BTB domain-containing protein n=1 Tax=Aquatica leii TaxID=1421715 RepID=A0AAN7PB51_9COLE|nr:hypothetical protein RN001_004761 [Aquatica leii]
MPQDCCSSQDKILSFKPKIQKMLEDYDNSCQIEVDNSQNILNTLENLYEDRQMCDVVISVGNKEHAAHRLILCASSDVFQAMLMKPEWSEWHESRIVLQELPQCESVFHLFLEYFYTGKIIITHTNVMPILALADKYMVKSLTQVCIKYMCKHIAHAASHNQLFSWLQYTTTCGYDDVANLCQNYIKWNFESVANTPDFSNFETELLCDLLKQSDLVVYNEIVLYNCIVRWLDLQRIHMNQLKLNEAEIQSQMQTTVNIVMKCIRFPMMSPREIADLLLSPLLKQYSHIMLQHMAFGMLFQNGKNEDLDKFYSTEDERLLCTPRLYTCDRFNSTLLIENVPNIPSYNVTTLVFSTHMSAAEYESDKLREWVVDLYPKGVCFKKCYLIVWQGTLEVPERVKSTVRLSLTCREFIGNFKANVAILLYGTQGGVEHIMQVKQRTHHFNFQDQVLVIDNLIPFEELNPPAGEIFSKSTERDSKSKSMFLTGPHRDQLKINIIITPVTSF